jgi:hypothetical protein
LLTVKELIEKKYAPLFNGMLFTSISVNLDGSEVMEFCNLNEVQLGLSFI